MSALKGVRVGSSADGFAQNSLKENQEQIGGGGVSVQFRRTGSLKASRVLASSQDGAGVPTNTSADPVPKGDRGRSISPSKALVTPQSPELSKDYGPIKRVFTFGKGRSEGNKGMKALLGGKGANLAEMATIGLSVPPGLTISTEACQEYQEVGKNLTEGLWEEVLKSLEIVENFMGAVLGDPSRPLLLSVRSGAAVMGIPHSLFEEKLQELKLQKESNLTASDLKELVEQYKKVYFEAQGEHFPSDPKKQLMLVVHAVFDSWDSPRAIKYRSINNITGLKGTVVNIQCMVFGNMGDTSGTGVLFTRNPSTGEKKLYGEFLVNDQIRG